MGYISVGGVYRASLWNGTAASWVNLEAFFPAGFSFSSNPPPRVWSDGTTLFVGCRARNNAAGRDEALVLTRPLTSACYPNCDASTAVPILNVNDFVCFLNRFAAGDTYANCDASTAAPVLNVNDFICFTNAFAAGCP